MNELIAQKDRFAVAFDEPEETSGVLFFRVVPKHIEGSNGAARSRVQFTVAVCQDAGKVAFDWSGTPDDPGAFREEIEAEIADRMRDRNAWIERVTSLVDQVERWAKELRWSTRRVEKKLDDHRIGKHRVPALLMQEDTCRVLLEPLGRSAPGAEGVVDLYLMPAYDDIATLYYRDDRWNLHYMFPGSSPVSTIGDTESMPLSKEILQKVLAEMRQNAA